MNFNSFLENKAISNSKVSTDDSEVKELNDTLIPDSDELTKVFDDSCPISGEVFKAMKESAADPRNVKMVVMRESDTISAIYVEATEFINFCEASDLDIAEAADTLVEICKEDCPSIDDAEIHVVFPSKVKERNIIGGRNIGLNIKNDWPMELMRGCRRFGITTNIGVDTTNECIDNSVDEAAVKENFFDDAIDKKMEELDKAIKEDKKKNKDKDNKKKSYKEKALEWLKKKKKQEKEKKFKEVK